MLLKISACVAVLSMSLVLNASEKKAEGMTKAEAQRQVYINADHLLDGTKFEYFYKAGGGLKIAFANGVVGYEWIKGPRKGNKGNDIPYQSRKIGDELYVVNWQEKHKPDFTSLIINLKNKKMYSSAILRYGTEKEMIHFKEAEIKNIQRTTTK